MTLNGKRIMRAGMRRLSQTLLGLAVVLMFNATLAVAQYRASIQGQVTDPQGRGVWAPASSSRT